LLADWNELFATEHAEQPDQRNERWGRRPHADQVVGDTDENAGAE
jgi:hypothetical protein